MAPLRRYLRLWVAVWLVFQVASLSALVPRECCAAHRQAATRAKPSCHETAPATQCPMRAGGGTPCPMHSGDHTGASNSSRDGCAMRGACSGPIAALFAQLSNYGVVTNSFQWQPDLQRGSAAVSTLEQLVTRLASPDPPPPRA